MKKSIMMLLGGLAVVSAIAISKPSMAETVSEKEVDVRVDNESKKAEVLNGLYENSGCVKLTQAEIEKKFKQNLDLTYGVRDGIISHCGEIDENCLKPREEFIDLNDYKFPNQYAPYTWEGCVVKISDKISYLCRDIEDALTLKIFKDLPGEEDIINNTNLINNLNNILYILSI